MFSLRMLLLLCVMSTMHSVRCGNAHMFKGGEMKNRDKRASCPFDYCMLPQVCFNGATCTLNNQCIVYCNCTEGYSGPKCRASATTASITAQSAKTETIGVDTTIPSATTRQSKICTIDFCTMGQICFNGATCSLNDQCFPICKCAQGYFGPKCGDVITPMSTVNQTIKPTITSTVKLVDGCPDGLECLEGYCEGTLRECPNCPGGFACLNGYCQLSPTGVTCLCYVGYSGGMCQDECLLDCGLNGTCSHVIDDTGTGTIPICFCDPEFLPGNCTILRPVTSKYVVNLSTLCMI